MSYTTQESEVGEDSGGGRDGTDATPIEQRPQTGVRCGLTIIGPDCAITISHNDSHGRPPAGLTFNAGVPLSFLRIGGMSK